MRLACGAGRQRLIPRPHSTPFADGPRHAAPRRPSGPTESAKEPNKHTYTQTKANLRANELGMFLPCKIFHQQYLEINHSYENETGLCRSGKIKCLFLTMSHVWLILCVCVLGKFLSHHVNKQNWIFNFNKLLLRKFGFKKLTDSEFFSSC